jgi:hypothetical protein
LALWNSIYPKAVIQPSAGNVGASDLLATRNTGQQERTQVKKDLAQNRHVDASGETTCTVGVPNIFLQELQSYYDLGLESSLDLAA